LALAGFVFIKTKKFSKTIFTIIGTYSALFFMAAFPSLLYYLFSLLSGKALSSLHSFEIIQFLAKARFFSIELANPSYALASNLNLFYFPLCIAISSYFFWKSERKMFLAVLRNLRFPQVLFHGGLFFFGLGIGLIMYPESFSPNIFSILAALNVLLSIILAWEASVIVNDIFDYRVDNVSNPERPLQKGLFTFGQYAQLGAIVFSLSIIGGAMVHYKFGILLLVYQIMAWFYSAEPFRLKRFALIASLLSALTLLTVFFSGFIFFSPDQDIDRLSWRIIFMLIITYTLSLPIKDFKDIEGDKKDGVYTVPVIFGEEKGRLIVASGIFASFVLSIFFINELRLFWWAILFGSASFLIMVSKKIHPRTVHVWVFPLILAYGLIAVKIIFFSF
jgi:4-hydroxybenzoate polyprenyltransferase